MAPVRIFLFTFACRACLATAHPALGAFMLRKLSCWVCIGMPNPKLTRNRLVRLAERWTDGTCLFSPLKVCHSFCLAAWPQDRVYYVNSGIVRVLDTKVTDGVCSSAVPIMCLAYLHRRLAKVAGSGLVLSMQVAVMEAVYACPKVGHAGTCKCPTKMSPEWWALPPQSVCVLHHMSSARLDSLAHLAAVPLLRCVCADAVCFGTGDTVRMVVRDGVAEVGAGTLRPHPTRLRFYTQLLHRADARSAHPVSCYNCPCKLMKDISHLPGYLGD